MFERFEINGIPFYPTCIHGSPLNLINSAPNPPLQYHCTNPELSLFFIKIQILDKNRNAIIGNNIPLKKLEKNWK